MTNAYSVSSMLRLSDESYIENRRVLRANHEDNRNAFILLSANEQWDLFQYYFPHKVQSREEMLLHRREVSALDSSLPQRAGRAFRRLRRIRETLPSYHQYAATRHRIKKNAKKQIVVFSEVYPDLDAAQVARIVLDVVTERASSDAVMGAADGDPLVAESGLDCAGIEAKTLADFGE